MNSLRVVITFAGFASLVVAGYLLMRVAAKPPSQLLKVTATILATVVVLLLMALSGLIYAFSTCSQ